MVSFQLNKLNMDASTSNASKGDQFPKIRFATELHHLYSLRNSNPYLSPFNDDASTNWAKGANFVPILGLEPRRLTTLVSRTSMSTFHHIGKLMRFGRDSNPNLSSV